MSAQLLVYGFRNDSDFAGQLVGALERLESGGALRVADALFVMAPEEGEVVAVALEGRRLGVMVASLLEFRLDPAAQRRATTAALEGATVRALAEAIPAGTAFAAVLVEHVWAQALEDAVGRAGGTRLADAEVDAGSLATVEGDLVDAVRLLTSRA